MAPISNDSTNNNTYVRAVATEKRNIFWYIVSAAIVIVLVIAYLLLSFLGLIPDGSTNAMATSDTLNILSTVVFLAASTLAVIRSRNLKIGMGIIAFTLCALFYFIAEVTWAAYNFILNVDVPSPSVADVFYILGAVTFVVALLLVIKSLSGKARLSAPVIIFTVAGSALLAAALYVISYGLSPDSLDLSSAVDIAYPVLDFVSIVLVIKLLAVSLDKGVAQAQIILAAGVFITSVSDILFAFGTATGLYTTGSITDFLFAAGYLLFAISVWRYVGLTKNDIVDDRLAGLRNKAMIR